MIGQTLDHYRVLAQIRQRRQGVVYRARDEVLNRDVALKLFAHGTLDNVGRSQLLREAQTAPVLEKLTQLDTVSRPLLRHCFLSTWAYDALCVEVFTLAEPRRGHLEARVLAGIRTALIAIG